MSPRIITSKPAFRARLSQSQRDRMGRVLPMVDEHGQPWTTIRLVCEAVLCGCALALPFMLWAVLS